MRRRNFRTQEMRRYKARLGKSAIGLLVTVCLTVEIAAGQQPAPAAGRTTNRTQANQTATPADPTAAANPTGRKTAAAGLEEKIAQIAASGRIQHIGESSSARLNPAPPLAPGAPPILAFRYFDGQARHRFGSLDMVMDDAGH